MTYYALSALINFLTSITLGSFILFRNSRNTVSITFVIFTYSVGAWSFAYYLWQISSDPSTALFWSRLLMSFALFIPVSYVHFIFSLIGVEKNRGLFLKVSYTIFFIYLLINTFTDLVVSSVRPLLGFKYWPVPGPFFSIVLATWLGYMIYSLVLLYKSYFRETEIKKLQIKYLLLGSIIGYSGGITNYFLWYGVPIAPIGNILASVYIGITAYTIAKHRLLDIRLVVALTISYSLLLLIIGLFYSFSTIALSSYLFQESLDKNRLLVSTILTLVVAFTFQPLRKLLELVTDKIFFKGAYDTNTLLNRLSRIMATNIYLQQITQKLLDELLTEMRISRGVFILTEAGKIFDIQAHGMQDYKKFSDIDVMSLIDEQKMLVFEELEEGQIKDIMRKMDITVAAPLKSGNEEIGILFLGEKLYGDIYSDQDLKLLEIFIPEASIAIQNAQAYEEIRRFNITLKEEINKATAELKNANFKLQELDKLKDEFVSVASPGLRTPMTAIKYYLWLILKGKKIDEAKTKIVLYSRHRR